MRLQRRFALGVVESLLSGCASQSHDPAPRPGRSPLVLEIRVGSRLDIRAYTPEELATPWVQSIVAQCERARLNGCLQSRTVGNDDVKFVRAEARQVAVEVKLRGVELDRDYTVRFRLFDPLGGLRAGAGLTLRSPREYQSGASLTYAFTWTPPTDRSEWPVGRWRIEIAVNDHVEGERFFEVVERA